MKFFPMFLGKGLAALFWIILPCFSHDHAQTVNINHFFVHNWNLRVYTSKIKQVNDQCFSEGFLHYLLNYIQKNKAEVSKITSPISIPIAKNVS